MALLVLAASVSVSSCKLTPVTNLDGEKEVELTWSLRVSPDVSTEEDFSVDGKGAARAVCMLKELNRRGNLTV